MEVLLKVCVSSPEWVCIQPSPHSFQDTCPNPPLQHFLKPHSKAAQSFSSQSSSSSCWSAAPHGDGVGVGERAAGKNELTWRRLILDMTKCGKSREALRIYKQMQEAGVKPSTHTFVAALKACSSLGDLETGKKIHAHVIENGVDSQVFVASILMSMYANCGSMAEARRIFERIPVGDVVLWNAMIQGYAQRDEGEEALKLYARMRCEGFVPDARTFVGALKACSLLAAQEEGKDIDGKLVKLGSLQKGRAIHSQVAKLGFDSNKFVATTLVDMYAKCGSMEDAQRVFDNMPLRDVVSWNAMIMGYAQSEEGELALHLFAHLQHEGITSNARTFVGAIKACACSASQEEGKEVNGKFVKTRSLESGRGIHSQVTHSGFDSNIFVATTLVDMYAKCGSMVEASRVFDKMPYRNVVSWNALILGYAVREEGEQALQLYARMQHEGFAPKSQTFVGALKACACLAVQEEGKEVDGKLVKLLSLEKGRDIHFQVAQNGFNSDVFVATTLVDLYAKCGSMEDAREVFDRMPLRDIASWNAMIHGYAQRDQGELALQFYARMQHEGIASNPRTFLGALKACSSVAALDYGRRIHAEICKLGLEADTIVGTSLLDMYSKCGSMNDAQQLFDALHQRDLVTWNALIAGHSRQGDSESVFKLFERMHHEGIKPNDITFLSILTVCSHVGLLDHGRKYFNCMNADYGIAPTIDHYNCMVDLLGRAGQLDEAMGVVKKMPLQPNMSTWCTILGACLKWNDVEVGKCAFECALTLNDVHVEAYVMMSNIYASSGMDEESCKIQVMRRNALARTKPMN